MAPIFIFLSLIPFWLQARSASLSSQQTVLLSLKQQWGNPASLDSWNTTSSPCDWPEIQCFNNEVIAINLQEKNLTGPIPSTLCQLTSLKEINLTKNSLSGDIPLSLCNCASLERLDLSTNLLTGTIPAKLLCMDRLRYLWLSYNMLSGEIPRPINSLRLDTLVLSHNQLNGSIPEQIRDLYNLRKLDLTGNSLSGVIPGSLFRLHQLACLKLGHNQLSGEIPEDLDCFSFIILNLTHNHLSGVVPRGFGDITQLTTLDLSYNNFSGDIKENVTHLRAKIVKLCSNNFSGKIPYEYMEMTFGENCVDEANLCSDNKAKGLATCPSDLCTDSRIHYFLICIVDSQFRGGNKNHYAIILPASIAGTLLGLIVIVFFLLPRKWWRKNKEINDSGWNMIPFKKLDFTKWEVLSSLTEENLIGHGGSGKIYRVFIKRTGKYVAVKSIMNENKSDYMLEKEFLAEIQILGAISHYNIVRLLCCISGKTVKLLIYEYFENQSLDQWLHGKNKDRGQVLDWPTRLKIAVGSARGLCYMHHECSPSIIHRDIKSSNILLDPQFEAKIADFGVAKILLQLEVPESASVVAGTFGYIAPEYAYSMKVNPKSDVYSFGVVLLELTTGREAIAADENVNLEGWARMHQIQKKPIVDALDEKIKEARYLEEMTSVFRLGLVCTAKSPSKRPTMKDVYQILQDLQKDSRDDN